MAEERAEDRAGEWFAPEAGERVLMRGGPEWGPCLRAVAVRSLKFAGAILGIMVLVGKVTSVSSAVIAVQIAFGIFAVGMAGGLALEALGRKGQRWVLTDRRVATARGASLTLSKALAPTVTATSVRLTGPTRGRLELPHLHEPGVVGRRIEAAREAARALSGTGAGAAE